MARNFLGLDWGEKEIGVALAHAETQMALSLCIIQNDRSLWKELAKIIAQEEIGAVIIGVPEYQEAVTAKRARNFARDLEQRFPEIRVQTASEMFTSKMANARLKEAQKKGAKDHAEAACIILADWLEKR